MAEFENKIIAVHYRKDAMESIESIAEMIYICGAAGVPLQVSHIGSCSAFGMMPQALSLIEKARAAGLDVTVDCYPYAAFCTHIGSAVFDEGCFERWKGSYEMLFITEGKYKGQKCTKEIFEYLRKNEPFTYVVASVMNPKDVDLAIQHPMVMVASDGGLHNGQGHPRASATFPRVLRQYVREEKTLPMIEAITKMTLMPAKRLRLRNKGAIFVGSDADITVFDPAVIGEQATFERPVEPPVGIEYVFVNGRPVVYGGKETGEKPGKALHFI